MRRPEPRFLQAAGLRLRALVQATGEGAGTGERRRSPVLVLHGFTGSAESMEGVAEALCDRHCVARLELVGHGESDAPEDEARYSMSACAAQILEAADGLALERPHLIGYSMGGRAALATALASPSRFASLVLVGATAGLADPGQRAERIASDRALAERIEREGVERFVDEWMARPLFASQARLGASALARARAQRLRNRASGLAGSLRGMGTGAQPPLHDRLAELDLPALLVVGEEDMKFREIAEQLAGEMPDARVRQLADAGHAAHLEAPEAFAEVVRRFFDEVEARPDAGVKSRAAVEPGAEPGAGPGAEPGRAAGPPGRAAADGAEGSS
ncbi:MAG: 2-succinyl-6-hydroxy-2,4-cyclohexadiene-1-carboxylate synthase [bacterium]